MSLIQSKLLRGDLRPFAQNPIYVHSIHIKCCFCKNQRGRKKIYPGLWIWFMHSKTHHSDEPRLMEITFTLAKLIVEGIL